jgi:hypothetical protein
MVAAAYFALGKTVSLMTVFLCARFLCLALLPVSFFAAARRLEFAVPAGTHHVAVRWGRSPAQQCGEGISLAALIAPGVAVECARRFSRAAAKHPAQAAIKAKS